MLDVSNVEKDNASEKERGTKSRNVWLPYEIVERHATS